MEFLHASFLGYALWLWLVFGGVVVTLLALDLGVLHREGGEISVTESLWLSAGYIAVAVAFGGWLWWQVGAQQGMDYFTAYAVEKSLSLGAGATLVQEFHWVLYLFAAFLIYTGIKMLWAADHAPDPMHNPVLRLIRRVVPVTEQLHGKAFWVKQPDAHGRVRRIATPLFMALVTVELADLVFAVDSVPAVFAVTADPFVVYTSNIFAILGLRALYFALAAILHRFAYLKYALALVLVFIGGKIIAAEWVGKIPSAISLSVTFGLLAAGVLFSLWKTHGAASEGRPAGG